MWPDTTPLVRAVEDLTVTAWRKTALRVVALALLLASGPAVAQPTKWPLLDGADATMPRFFRDSQNYGTGLGWWWFDGLRWRLAGGVITYAQMQALWGHTRYHEVGSGWIAEVWAAEDKRAKAAEVYKRVMTGTPCHEATDAQQQSLCAEFVAYMRASRPDDPVFVVAPNSTYTTRPAYPFANGVRGSTSNGRATVGAPCDCVAAGVLEGRSAYCGVNGRSDQVALCRRQ